MRVSVFMCWLWNKIIKFWMLLIPNEIKTMTHQSPAEVGVCALHWHFLGRVAWASVIFWPGPLLFHWRGLASDHNPGLVQFLVPESPNFGELCWLGLPPSARAGPDPPNFGELGWLGLACRDGSLPAALHTLWALCVAALQPGGLEVAPLVRHYKLSMQVSGNLCSQCGMPTSTRKLVGTVCGGPGDVILSFSMRPYTVGLMCKNSPFISPNLDPRRFQTFLQWVHLIFPTSCFQFLFTCSGARNSHNTSCNFLVSRSSPSRFAIVFKNEPSAKPWNSSSAIRWRRQALNLFSAQSGDRFARQSWDNMQHDQFITSIDPNIGTLNQSSGSLNRNIAKASMNKNAEKIQSFQRVVRNWATYIRNMFGRFWQQSCR